MAGHRRTMTDQQSLKEGRIATAYNRGKGANERELTANKAPRDT